MHEEDFELTFDLEPLEPAPQPKAAAPAVPVPRAAAARHIFNVKRRAY